MVKLKFSSDFQVIPSSGILPPPPNLTYIINSSDNQKLAIYFKNISEAESLGPGSQTPVVSRMNVQREHRSERESHPEKLQAGQLASLSNDNR